MHHKKKAAKTPKIALPAPVIYLPTVVEQEARLLREEIIEACSSFERITTQGQKDYLRALHIEAKRHSPGFQPSAIMSLFHKHAAFFRRGHEIDPAKIKPVLRIVEDPQDKELFAIVRAFWSMPYNKGYGRRLRFIVFDEYHQAVIGILGLQSPPADIACRDSLFNYERGTKLERVNCTMDAYTVGAIPPYSFLLGGKLCAGLISTDAVRQAYWRRYAGKKTEMNNVGIHQPLVAVTTTSAFGRSSIYNRLKYRERFLAQPIGFTQGYGTLHLEHLYSRICEYLRMTNQFKNGGFGNGPKVRWQNITNSLIALGLPQELLRHGVKREVFLFSLVENLAEGMSSGEFGAPLLLSEDEYSSFWKERWALPRAQRYPDWKSIDAIQILQEKLKEIEKIES